MVIVKSTEGWVFGGYAADSWNSNNESCGSCDCFLFSLFSPINKFPTAYNFMQDEFCLIYSPECGPTFGCGYDLHISDNSNSNEGSYSYMKTYADGIREGVFHWHSKCYLSRN